MKYLVTLFIALSAMTAIAQDRQLEWRHERYAHGTYTHGHRHHGWDGRHNGEVLGALIIGGMIGSAIASRPQPAPAPQPIIVQPQYSPQVIQQQIFVAPRQRVCYNYPIYNEIDVIVGYQQFCQTN